MEKITTPSPTRNPRASLARHFGPVRTEGLASEARTVADRSTAAGRRRPATPVLKELLEPF